MDRRKVQVRKFEFLDRGEVLRQVVATGAPELLHLSQKELTLVDGFDLRIGDRPRECFVLVEVMIGLDVAHHTGVGVKSLTLIQRVGLVR